MHDDIVERGARAIRNKLSRIGIVDSVSDEALARPVLKLAFERAAEIARAEIASADDGRRNAASLTVGKIVSVLLAEASRL